MHSINHDQSRAATVSRRLTRAHALAAVLIGTTIITATTAAITIIRQQEPEGARINLLGRQRVLTERMIAAGYAAALAPYGDEAGAIEARDALQLANAVRVHGAAVLRGGDVPLRIARADASERIALDRLAEIDPSITAAIATLMHRAPTDSVMRTVNRLAVLGRRQIEMFDSLASAAAFAQHARANHLEILQLTFGAGLLVLLLVGGTVIVRPAAQRVTTLLDAERVTADDLYQQTQELSRQSALQQLANSELESQRFFLAQHKDELLEQQSALIDQRDHLTLRTGELSRLTAILDATPDAVLAFSLDGSILYANAEAERLLTGVRRRDWKHAAFAMTKDGIALMRRTGFPTALRDGLWRGETILRGVGAQPERTMILTLQTHRVTSDRVTTVSVMLHDVSDMRLTERRLAASEARARLVIDSLAEGVVVQDRAGRVISCNASAERALGLTKDQLSGRSSMDPSWQAVDATGAPMPVDMYPIVRAQRHGIEIDDEVMGVQHADGSRVWLSVNARPIRDSIDEHDAAAVATFSDITRARAAARELEALSLVARQSDYAIAMHDREGRVLWINDAWETMTGYSLADAIGRMPGTFLRGTHTDPGTAAAISASLRAGGKWTGEILHYRRDGTPYWSELHISPTLAEDGTPTGFSGLARDVSERRKADRERTQLVAALAVTADGIATTSIGGTLEFVNAAFARMHGRTVQELLHTPWTTLYEASESARLARDIMPEVMHAGFWHGETTGCRADGSSYPQELSLTLMPHGGLVTVARDISDRKNAEEQLRRFSLRDSLTGLYNRRGFLEQTEAALKLAARQGVACALLYGDLDDFKKVNDGFGHDAGDAALRTIAGILTGTCRDTDLTARLGGDEFTILAIGVTPPDVDQLVSRIDAAVAENNRERSHDITLAWHLGISLGAAYFDPAAPVAVESLLRVADAALYDRKRLRNNAARQAA